MAENLQNPPIASPIVNLKTGLPTASFANWMVRLFTRAGSNTGGLAPSDAEYVINTANNELSNAQILGNLSSGFVKVTTTSGVLSSTGNTTIQSGDIASSAVTTAKIADSNVTTVKIADSNVTLAKLSSGITPSHRIVFAAGRTTPGGSDTDTVSVPGVLTSDAVFVQLKTVGATPRTILTAATNTDQVIVTFSGDPSTDHVYNYQVIRAVS